MSEDKGTIALDRNPTPKGESEQFENLDERAAKSKQDHEARLLSMNQGPIGKLIGCTDSSLTIAFTLLLLGFIALICSFVGLIYKPEVFSPYPEKVITFMLTIAGYVMGKKTGIEHH